MRLDTVVPNAPHQHGVAERSICIVSKMVQAMLLQLSANRKYGIDAFLCLMAVKYALHVYTHTLNSKNLLTNDLLTGSIVPRSRLGYIHTCKRPVYALDPTLPTGKKLAKWEPCSRRGLFVGLSSFTPRDYQ
jgi:hypothetical protein